MRRITWAISFAAVIITTSTSQAGWSEFWAGVKLDWHRMNCWPEPFSHADRELVRQPLVAMTDNGWRMQNTLSDHLFTPGEQTLTQAGALKLRWIATQTPTHRRTIFVLRAATPEETAIRVDAVQEALSRLSLEGSRPEVLLTDIIPVGGSGDYFDAVDRQLKESIPAPRLPQANPISSN